jgi:hypothetical protein
MMERRAHKRYKIELLGVTGITLKANSIDIVDISLKGISLHATMRLNVGKEYTIKIQTGVKVLNLKGLVIWSRISKSRSGLGGDSVPVYTAGLEFQHMTKEQQKEIAKFMDGYKKEKDTKADEPDLVFRNIRQYPRVCVHTPVESFIINPAQSLPVKDLSFGGFRTESSDAMKISSTVPCMISFSEDKCIVFQGRITFCRLIKRAYPKVYDIGIEFNKMSVQDRKTLSEFIRLLDSIDRSPSE